MRRLSAFLLPLLLFLPLSGLTDGVALSAQPSIDENSTNPVPGRDGLFVTIDGPVRQLHWLGESPFHTTTSAVTNIRTVAVPGSPVAIALWEERPTDAAPVPYYAISLDGRRVARVRQASYTVKLRHGDFDPAAGVPEVQAALAARETSNLYVVQFVTQPLEAFRSAIESSGGTVYNFLAHNSHIVKMSPEVRGRVAAFPFVRWVGPYHAAYRLEEFMRDNVDRAESLYPLQRYHVKVFESGDEQKGIVADRIRTIGGKIDMADAGKFLLDATLTPRQLFEVAQWDEVSFVDRWSAPRATMNNVRIVGGADYLEGVAGYTGAGVRAEIMDNGCQLNHPDFAGRIAVRGNVGFPIEFHGTATFGIIFGSGAGSGTARGLMPDAFGYFNDWSLQTSRYNDLGQLVLPPFNCVFQSNSWGFQSTPEYTSVSAEMDDAVFDFDIVILHSQGNDGTQSSVEHAWGKNVVGVGGVLHFDDADPSNDSWSGTGSIGPASDGRIQPDLCYYYESIRTTSPGGYTNSMGGTSAACPETAGHFGLFYQMWADGLFGNVVSGGTVFAERPHATTARAIMVHTASQYPFSGTGHDLTRVHQGWGRADVQNLYDNRNRLFIIDESQVLRLFQGSSHQMNVGAGESEFKATMIYADPGGTTSSSQHRINDLTLKVTSPSNVVYWGNNGLLEGNWSTPGGSPNTIDTVENVFIQNPEAGLWTVEVLADEINQDGHVETPQMDADFALIISCDFCNDCNENGVPDQFDIANGTSSDCNNNGLPDECEGDVCPPTPDPMTWDVSPGPVSTTELTMTATQAIDDTPPVEYYFFWWGDGSGGNTSGWLPSNTYNDDGLVANTVYTYQTRARDGADLHNYGMYSFAASAATHIETPAGFSFGSVTETYIEATATGTFTNLAVGNSGLYFEWEETVTGTPVGSSGWVLTATVTATGLSPSTRYTFRARARNQDQVETAVVEARETTDGDCNGNGIPDREDIANGTSLDCNANVIPDECEPGVVPCGVLDIKPGGCPNPLNRSSQGFLPVAVVGTAHFDVTMFNVSSLRLSRADGVGGEVAPNEGPPGPHSVFADVATPFEGESCDCHNFEGDGIDDLSMKFSTQDVVAALELGSLTGGDAVELVITGTLLDGTSITTGSDCVVIVPAGNTAVRARPSPSGSAFSGRPQITRQSRP